jgi:hypothetical protein
MIRQYRENFASSRRVLNEAQKHLEERTERERKAQQDFSAIHQELGVLPSAVYRSYCRSCWPGVSLEDDLVYDSIYGSKPAGSHSDNSE